MATGPATPAASAMGAAHRVGLASPGGRGRLGQGGSAPAPCMPEIRGPHNGGSCY